MAISGDKKLEILNDHYKDTFSHLLNYLKRRDRLFFYLLVVLAIMFLQVVAPDEPQLVISKWIEKNVGEGGAINTSFIRGIIWFVLLSLVLRYFQTTVFVERQYAYLHKLEQELSFLSLSGVAFTREGKSYLKNYPKLSDWADVLYTWVFPGLLLILVTIEVVIEFPGKNQISFAWGFSFVVCLMIWVTTALYLCFRFQQMTADRDKSEGE